MVEAAAVVVVVVVRATSLLVTPLVAAETHSHRCLNSVRSVVTSCHFFFRARYSSATEPTLPPLLGSFAIVHFHIAVYHHSRIPPFRSPLNLFSPARSELLPTSQQFFRLAP